MGSVPQDDSDQRPFELRGYSARVGVSALNLIAPGLGLLRIGERRLALTFLALPYVLIAPMTLVSGRLPITGYGTALAAFTAACTIIAMLYLVPVMITWRRSRVRRPMRQWSNWYAVAATAVSAMTLSVMVVPLAQRFYKPFYEPSTSMAPTIGLGDRFVADMRWRGPVARGDVILFESDGYVRVSRVAATARDRIALRRGVPIIDGTPVARRRVGVAHLDEIGGGSARLSIERLPGEASPHRVLDIGDSPFGNMREIVVPDDHVFVLGDNRDRSADSRVPRSELGVGMVPLRAIIGRPLYVRWSRDHAKIGERLDR